MRSKNGYWVLAVAISAAVCAGGCKRSAEAERKDSEQAEQQNATQQTSESARRALDEKNDWLSTVRREQLDLRNRLQDEIDNIDRQLETAPKPDPKKTSELIERRQRLESDVNVVQRSDERGWDETKALIEKDLSPESTPSWFRPTNGKI